MHNLMHVWDCPACGERLDDEIEYGADVVDPEHDTVVTMNLCHCGREVTKRMSVGSDGQPIPVMAEVSDERAEWFRLEGVDNDEEYNRYVDYGDE